MSEIFEKIKQVKELELPFDISKKVMRRIMLYRLRLPLFLTALFSVNFIYLCSRIYSFLSNTGAFAIIKVVLFDFEMSQDYIGESIDGLAETMPMTDLRLLAVNVVLMILLSAYAIYIYRTGKKHLLTNS